MKQSLEWRLFRLSREAGLMQLHLDEIATKVIPGAHAIVVLDQAGWLALKPW